jgi:gamma-glutamylcyclotransferase (GGCT)/AIG2-like uncharacterized protein YtfP
MEDCSLLFVYGSLLEGFFNYEKTLVGCVVSRRDATVRGTLYHQTAKGYPALVSGDRWVCGELLGLSDLEDRLPQLDEVEGFLGEGQENEYDRIVTDVYVPETDEWVKAYVYWYGLDDLGTESNPVVPIPDGSWRKFMEKRT